MSKQIEDLETMLKALTPQQPQYAGVPLRPEEMQSQQVGPKQEAPAPAGYQPIIQKSQVKQITPTKSVVDSQDIQVEGYQEEVPSFEPKVKRILPTKYSDVLLPQDEPGMTANPDGTIGGVAPDYSAFEKLKEELRGAKPKDTSLIDMLSMLVPTAVGAAYGQLGAGAIPAGEWGIQRAKDVEKREQTLEDALRKVDLEMAQARAKGVKGQDVSKGLGGFRARLWEDDEGNQRISQRMGTDGNWSRGSKDPVYKSATIRYRDEKLPEGGVTQVATRGNLKTSVGASNPSYRTVKDAEGRVKAFNPRGATIESLGKDFEQTGMGLTPDDTKDYKDIASRVKSDKILTGLESSYNDIVTGTTALGRGDIGSMKLAVKSLASALEKGRVVSDRDYQQVAEMNLGVVAQLSEKVNRLKQGDKGIDEIRKEIASAFSVLNTTTQQAYDRRANVYDLEIRRQIGDRKDLLTPRLPKFTGEKQKQNVIQSSDMSSQMMSGGEMEGYVKMPDGSIKKLKFVKDAQGNPVITEELP